MTNGIQPNVESAWGPWWRTILSDVLGPHFLITLVILVVWAIAIWGPIAAIGELSVALSKTPDEAAAKALGVTLSNLCNAAAAVSALFTTVLGLVLGHYFGQRSGTAIARQEKLESKEVAAEASNLANESGEVNADLAAQNNELKGLVKELVTLLPENIQLDKSSSLAKFLDPSA